MFYFNLKKLQAEGEREVFIQEKSLWITV